MLSFMQTKIKMKLKIHFNLVNYNSKQKQIINNYDFDIIENLWNTLLTTNENNYLIFIIIIDDNTINQLQLKFGAIAFIKNKHHRG